MLLGAVDATATAMNNALLSRGYCQSDMGLYKAFQTFAQLTADGFPGQNTMGTLKQYLEFNHITPANVPVYPWTLDANGGGQAAYDGVNAPEWDSWINCTGAPAPAPSPAPSPTPSPPPAPSPSPTPTPSSTSQTVGPLPWLIGGAIVVTAFAAWTYSGQKHKRRRHV